MIEELYQAKGRVKGKDNLNAIDRGYIAPWWRNILNTDILGNGYTDFLLHGS